MLSMKKGSSAHNIASSCIKEIEGVRILFVAATAPSHHFTELLIGL